MKIKKFNEGIWALSKDRHKRIEDGKKFIVKIEKLKKEIYPVFGDDILFDEFDGAIARIEELMELPEDQIKEAKKVLDDEEYFAFGLQMKDIRKIIILLFGELGLNMDDKSLLKQIQISVNERPATRLNTGGKYILVTEPGGFEIKIWEDGFVSLENGMDVKIKYDCALEVYSIILNKMK